MVTATGARVAQPNTPLTDKLPKVCHSVDYTDEHGICGMVYVMAKDPLDAIRQINHMKKEDVLSLPAAIYLPKEVDGLAGTGWTIVDSILYIGSETEGKTYQLPEKYSMPPSGYVGYWVF